MKRRYKIAESILELDMPADNDVWMQLEPNYEPFRVDEMAAYEPAVSVSIVEGLAGALPDIPMVYEDVPDSPDMLKLLIYRDEAENLYFKIIQPHDTHERAVLRLAPDFRNATIHLEAKGSQPRQWQTSASLTAAIQLAYHFAAQLDGNLLSHASSVLKDGKAYLFLGRSGMGKSTHSRMWHQAFADVVLLNDDHPILRVETSGEVIAYGSPWSGKTPCYKNLHAQIGAIVRICRGATNSIRRLSPIEAYASVMPSVFNAPFDRRITDMRHKLIEKIVMAVPCYQLHCLPDADAARVCHAGIENDKRKQKI